MPTYELRCRASTRLLSVFASTGSASPASASPVGGGGCCGGACGCG